MFRIRIRKPSKKTWAALATFALAIAGIPAYVSAYTVSGPSEAPTLIIGDVVIVNHAAYDWKLPYTNVLIAQVGDPRRGDLVLFAVPNREPGTLGLKRVVGLPGDHVGLVDNQVVINGQAARLEPVDRNRPEDKRVPDDHHLGRIVARETLAPDDPGHDITYSPQASTLRTLPASKVPESAYFLLGDHRDNSNDSRTFGAVDRRAILGRVVAVWPR